MCACSGGWALTCSAPCLPTRLPAPPPACWCAAGRREADERNRFHLPPGMSHSNLEAITRAVAEEGAAAGGASAEDAADGSAGSRFGRCVCVCIMRRPHTPTSQPKPPRRPQILLCSRCYHAAPRHFSNLFDQALTWECIPWLKSISPLPVIVKASGSGGGAGGVGPRLAAAWCPRPPSSVAVYADCLGPCFTAFASAGRAVAG